MNGINKEMEFGKISFDTLMFEITRRCNMRCVHCLRGDAENMDMSEDIMDAVLMETEHIGCIVFTGGEPAMNVHLIMHALEFCKSHYITVDSFFVATNGKDVSNEFLIAMLEWRAYCMECNGSEYDFCCVALSQDEFHEPISQRNKLLLSGLSFFDSDSKKTDFKKTPLINQGRASELSSYKLQELNHYDPTVEIEEQCGYYTVRVADGYIYVTADGDIKTDCDCAYDNDEYTIGSVKDNIAELLYDKFGGEETEE